MFFRKRIHDGLRHFRGRGRVRRKIQIQQQDFHAGRSCRRFVALSLTIL
jgi:hypothetical protein